MLEAIIGKGIYSYLNTIAFYMHFFNNLKNGIRWLSGDQVYQVDYQADEAGYRPTLTVKSALEMKPKPEIESDPEPEPEPAAEPEPEPAAAASVQDISESESIQQQADETKEDPSSAVPNVPNGFVASDDAIISPSSEPRPGEIFTDDAVIIDAVSSFNEQQEQEERSQLEGSLLANLYFANMFHEYQEQQREEEELRRKLEAAGIYLDTEPSEADQVPQVQPVGEKDSLTKYQNLVSLLSQTKGETGEDAESAAYLAGVYSYVERLLQARQQELEQNPEKAQSSDEVENAYWELLNEFYLDEAYRRQLLLQKEKEASKFDSGYDYDSQSEARFRQQILDDEEYLRALYYYVLAAQQPVPEYKREARYDFPHYYY